MDATPGPGYRLASALTPADVGRRVVLRRTIADGGVGDVVGVLEDWTAGRLRIATRTGTVEVAEADVLGGKPVPERTTPHERPPEVLASLERAAALGWRGLEEEPLGGWTLRAAAGFTGRANSVLPLGDPGLPFDRALDRVRSWYADRGLPPRFQVPVPLAADLDERLAASGWVTTEDVVVMACPVGTALRRSGVAEPMEGVTIAAEPDEGWLRRYRYRGGELPPVARRVLLLGDCLAFLSIPAAESGAPPDAVARGAVTADPLDPRRVWVGVAAVDVAEHVRRRGLGTWIVAAVLTWGAQQGATRSYLQVAEHNSAAIAMYSKMGYVEHHRYRYRTAP